MKMIYCKILLKTHDGLLQTIEHEFRSMGPKATRFLYLRAVRGHMGVMWVHLTKHQPEPQADDMSCWPAVVPPLTTRYLYWDGVGASGANKGCRGIGGHWGLHMKNEDSLLQSTLENSRWSIADNRIWAQVNGTHVSTTLGHQMPLPWGIEGACGVMGWGYIWQNISLTHRLMTCHADLRCLYWGVGTYV